MYMDMSGAAIGGIIAFIEILFIVIMLGILELRLKFKKINKTASELKWLKVKVV